MYDRISGEYSAIKSLFVGTCQGQSCSIHPDGVGLLSIQGPSILPWCHDLGQKEIKSGHRICLQCGAIRHPDSLMLGLSGGPQAHQKKWIERSGCYSFCTGFDDAAKIDESSFVAPLCRCSAGADR